MLGTYGEGPYILPLRTWAPRNHTYNGCWGPTERGHIYYHFGLRPQETTLTMVLGTYGEGPYILPLRSWAPRNHTYNGVGGLRRGAIYTTITDLGPKRPHLQWCWGTYGEGPYILPLRSWAPRNHTYNGVGGLRRGAIYTTITDLGPKRPHLQWCLGTYGEGPYILPLRTWTPRNHTYNGVGGLRRGAIYTTITDLGPKRPYLLWRWGPTGPLG